MAYKVRAGPRQNRLCAFDSINKKSRGARGVRGCSGREGALPKSPVVGAALFWEARALFDGVGVPLLP